MFLSMQVCKTIGIFLLFSCFHFINLFKSILIYHPFLSHSYMTTFNQTFYLGKNAKQKLCQLPCNSEIGLRPQ